MNYEEPNMNINNQNSNINNNENTPKKSNKKVLAIIIVVAALIVSFCSGLYYGKTLNNKCKDDDTLNDTTDDILSGNYTFNNFNSKASEITPGSDDELTKGIEMKEVFFNPKCKEAYSKYREAFVYGKNNNSTPVHIYITIEYYDGAGKRVDKTKHESYVYAGSEFVNKLDIKDDSLYKTVKLSYTAEKNKSYETTINIDQFELTPNMTSDKTISAFIKNNSDKKVYIDLACIHYKDGKIIFASHRSYLSADAGETAEHKFYSNQYLRLAPNYNSEMMEFDDYKVFIQGARYSNDETY